LTKEAIIQKTLEALEILPKEKAEEISDFADFLLRRYFFTTRNSNTSISK
jgi:hypothetical protein